MIQLYLIKMRYHELEIVISPTAAGEAFRSSDAANEHDATRRMCLPACYFIGQRLIESSWSSLKDDLSLVLLNEKAARVSR